MTMSRAFRSLRWLVHAILLGAAVGAMCGAASALFLWLLEHVTATRTEHPGLVYLLPLAGLGIGELYGRIGESVRTGNNLVLERVHGLGPRLPRRMAPLVLVGTLLTHLFGGSAGREGTAVQMGSSLADSLAHALRCDGETRRRLLGAGMAGGFGSVFGTPIAGCVFAMEVATVGHVDGRALVPALTAALVGDAVTRGLGVGHTHFPAVGALPLGPAVAAKWLVLAVAVALCVRLFVGLTEAIKGQLGERVPRLSLRMALGGALVLAGFVALGSDAYLGLGVPGIVRAFEDPTLPPAAFLLKLVFTAVTLGTGFMGGEVTPLFFVGACLGNTLGQALGLPLSLAAAVTLAATFGAAANTPLALSIMAAELFGVHVLPHTMLVAVLAFSLTGERGIYVAQRVLTTKRGAVLARPTPLRDVPHGHTHPPVDPNREPPA
jgi:H+/Cl- antiporter ClcA